MIIVGRHHQLGLTRARALAERMARKLQRDSGGSYAWTGNNLEFHRPGATGRVKVSADDLEVSVELGLVLRPLGSRIEREIGAFFDEHLDASERRAGSEGVRPAVQRRGGTRPS